MEAMNQTEAMKINNCANVIELLNTHSEMRVTQSALRSAHDAITSRVGEEFVGSATEDGNRLVKEMKDSAARPPWKMSSTSTSRLTFSGSEN